MISWSSRPDKDSVVYDVVMFCNNLWNQVVWRHVVAEIHCINIKTTETRYLGTNFLIAYKNGSQNLNFLAA